MSLQIASSEVYATCCSIKQYLDAPDSIPSQRLCDIDWLLNFHYLPRYEGIFTIASAYSEFCMSTIM